MFLHRISTVLLYRAKNRSQPRLISMALPREKVRIPDDLVFCVLAKLPLKSLKRFECVHKSWVNLFENPYFLSMYRNNIISKYDSINNSSVLLKQIPNYETPAKLFLLSGERFENKLQLDWPTPFQEENQAFILSSTVVHGMLCVHQGYFHARGPEIPHKIMLWNLTTQQFRLLPSLLIEDYPLGWVTCSKVHGFGYDCLTNDYKVIQCTHYIDPPVEETLWYIYSLRSSSWRKLDVNMPCKFIEASGFSLYLNEVCHWYGWIIQDWEIGQHLRLVSFNLRNEVVVTTHIPFSQAMDHHLDELNGSITYFQHCSNDKSFDIFVLGELGVKESWTKLFTFSPSPCPEKFLGVAKKRGIFVFFGNLFGGNEFGDDAITWFDLSTQVIQEVSIKGVASLCQVETILGIDI